MSPDKETLDSLKIDRTRAPRRPVPVGMILAVLMVVVIAGLAFWWFNRPKPVPVRTLLVQQSGGQGGDRTLLNASGYVIARRAATVSAKITGKVVEVLVEEGVRVEAGQVLARLDSSNAERTLELAEAQAESARAALNETRANLEQAEREFRRIAQLAEINVASASDRDQAEAAVKALRARLAKQETDVAVAEREVALAQQQLDDTIIRAPFAGIVTSKDAQPGEMVSPISAGGGFTRTGICTIVDMSSLEIEVDVSESYINRVEPDQPVEAVLNAYPDWRIPARVIAIIPTADRQKATVRVRVGFENLDPRILPEMGVKVAFQRAGEASQRPAEIVLPKSAVRQSNGRDAVWLVRNGKLERRAITVGSMRADQVVVAAGVSAGERVVIEGPDHLNEGATVVEKGR
ncbi:MAG TPA: efflux RND transporter periplasmic adaptor subunit [Verrucomicrobia bacterium]|nr:efflux RND transporter periplasmic adaptor subunit [Verrucomicrobiota bacterium]HOP98696.1 efflux RND transporter periplasmic adaptor subunit [Verrucomicrobiota bacterium]HPU57795.1 efflux RND transporter periplasmic adaptor subunit [Verrucomicrobiota bacterium]